jgi:hypothetical protein
MGWSLGYDETWCRWIGYGVPAYCDHPKCNTEIDRGLGYVCGGEPYGGERGCGLFFCGEHLHVPGQLCPRCATYRSRPYKRIKPEHPDWVRHMLTHESWAQWRTENSAEVEQMRRSITAEATLSTPTPASQNNDPPPTTAPFSTEPTVMQAHLLRDYRSEE